MPLEPTCGATTITPDEYQAQIAHRCGLQQEHHRTHHICFVCGHPWPAG